MLVFDILAYAVNDHVADLLVFQDNGHHLCDVQSMALSRDVECNHFHKVLCSF